MSKILATLCLIVMVSASAEARPKPKIQCFGKASNRVCTEAVAKAAPKHPWNDKWWWVGEGVIAASVAADYYVTARTLGPQFQEMSPLLGPNPSTARLTGIGFVGFGMETGFNTGIWYLSHNDPAKWMRIVGHAGIPVEDAAIEGIYAPLHNLHLFSQCHAARLQGC